MAIEAQLYSDNCFSLEGAQDFFMDNPCGFNLIPQQQQLIQLQDFDAQKKQSFSLGNFSVSGQIQKQGMEIDRFLTLQNEKLRLALQEQRKKQTAQILSFYESKAHLLLKQKEDEIRKASMRAIELQQYLKRLENENQTWQRVAKESESTVASLNDTMERLKETVPLSANAADDAVSFCGDVEEVETKKMVCKCCNSRASCVVMLPCRHMCSCRECDVFLDSCPVCRIVKKGSIEAVI